MLNIYGVEFVVSSHLSPWTFPQVLRFAPPSGKANTYKFLVYTNRGLSSHETQIEVIGLPL